MPVILPKRTQLAESENEGELALFNEDGELTLAGEVVADFLEHADFSAVFEHPEAENYLIVVEDAEDAEVFEEVLPGEVVMQLVDEDDLHEMFMHYLDLLGERALAEDGSLEDKARLAVFEHMMLDEKYRRGAFRKLRKVDPGLVNRMLGAMLAKGEIKRAKKAGGGYKGGDYEKGSRYRTGATKGAKRKQATIRRKKKAKLDRQKKQSRRGRRRLAALAASVGMEEGFVFGEGVPYGGAIFAVDANPNAVVEFDDSALAALCERFDVYDIEEMRKGKKKGGFFGKKKGGDDEEDDSADESVGDVGAFATAVGRPSLSEGASLARAVMKTNGTLIAKPVNG